MGRRRRRKRRQHAVNAAMAAHTAEAVHGDAASESTPEAAATDASSAAIDKTQSVSALADRAATALDLTRQNRDSYHPRALEAETPSRPSDNNGPEKGKVKASRNGPDNERKAVFTNVTDANQMASFGDSLRRQRELRRISLREISESTKINVRYLEALERNDFTHLPGGAFTKGFIRAYARYIGADENEIINAFLFEVSRQQQENVAGDSLLGKRLDTSVGNTKQGNRWLIVSIAIVALLVGLAVGGFFLMRWLNANGLTSF